MVKGLLVCANGYIEYREDISVSCVKGGSTVILQSANCALLHFEMEAYNNVCALKIVLKGQISQITKIHIYSSSTLNVPRFCDICP